MCASNNSLNSDTGFIIATIVLEVMVVDDLLCNIILFYI